MSPIDELRRLTRRELSARLAGGRPVHSSALAGWTYRGTTLGLPRLVERLTWQTFQKTFHRRPENDEVVGWNVRLHQDGLGAPSRPRRASGRPRCVWPYVVTDTPSGLVIDYRPFAPRLDPLRWTTDPVVALTSSPHGPLLGVSQLELFGATLETPTFFALEREAPISFVPDFFAPPVLSPRERRWADALFDALLGRPIADRSRFWTTVAAAAPPLPRLGLRAAVHLLTFLPLSQRRFRRPFFALASDEQLDCVEAMAAHGLLTVRQAVSTLKVIACLALFEEPAMRAAAAGRAA